VRAAVPVLAIPRGVDRPAIPVVTWEHRPGPGCAPLGSYRRREPEKTLLHAVVRDRLQPFLAAARDRSPSGRLDGLPRLGRGTGAGEHWHGWATIDAPPATVRPESASFSGQAFISPKMHRCCGGDATDTGVTVTWANLETGTTGPAHQVARCCRLTE